MAWTAPMTAVANTAFTAAQFNTYIRDNLLETAPARATTVSGYFVTSGANAIAERYTASATVPTQETLTSTSYTDLATPGPSVTVTTGTRALVFITALMGNNGTNSLSAASVAVSGASSITESDVWCLSTDGLTSSNYLRMTAAKLFTTLTAGSNTFTMKYRVGSGTGTFGDRDIAVVPF